MPEYVAELLEAIHGATPSLREMSEERSRLRPGPGKWCPRDVIGHLIDSASTRDSWTFVSIDERLRLRPRHNLDELAWKPLPRDQPATLDYFMSDYVAHLKHHLAQIGIGLD